MRLDKGNPSGITKTAGTGVPSKIDPEKLEKDEEITEKYTDDDQKIADSVRLKHPNRNTDKLPPTNAGGYKNK